METLNEKESETKPNKKLQNFLTKMSKPIVRKDRDEIKMYLLNNCLFDELTLFNNLII